MPGVAGLDPAAGDRIGFSECVRPGDQRAVEQTVAFLHAVRAKHLRLVLNPAQPEWNATLLAAFTGFELLVAPTCASLAGIKAILARPGMAAAVELPVGCPGDVLDAVRARGARVASADERGDVRLLHAMDPAGAGAWDIPQTAHAPWLVTGYATWRHDPGRQLAAFRDAVSAPVERIYWHAVRDDPDAGQDDPRQAHFGLLQESGQPKLLARLLTEGGLPAVERVSELALAAPAVLGARPVVVTGGAGFIGSNLADRLAADGHDVLILDALARPGVDANLAWLRQRHPRRVAMELADLRDRDAARDATARASVVFHLAAQVAVTTSMVEPEQDFDINARGTLNLIDGLRRHATKAPLIFASTNKVYGDLADVGVEDDADAYLPTDPAIRAHGISEARPLQFHTPYGCSKGASDQYVLDAAHSFGVPSAVLRMSCIYGPRQMGTEDQGWLAHFLISVLDGKPITVFGDGKQVRDVLYVDDCVAAYLGAWRHIGQVAGQAFNLGGGPENAVTLRGVIAEIERLTNRHAAVSYAGWRPGDQRYFVADARRAVASLGLAQPVGWRDGLARLARWLGDQRYPAARRELVGAGSEA